MAPTADSEQLLTSSLDLKSRDFNPAPTYLGGRRAELRFTVHRPPCGEVSLCWHRPSGGDVAGRVHVGVARPRFAGDAREDRLALAVFGRDVPACGASLRRVRSRDSFESARGLVVESGNQHAPPLGTARVQRNRTHPTFGTHTRP